MERNNDNNYDENYKEFFRIDVFLLITVMVHHVNAVLLHDSLRQLTALTEGHRYSNIFFYYNF